MAFERKNFVRIGSSQTDGVPTVWSYDSNDDLASDIPGNNVYFAEVRIFLQLGDHINIRGSDGVVDIFNVFFLAPEFVAVRSVITGDAGPASHIVVAGGEYTTVGGGLTESIPVPNINITDIVSSTIKVPNPAGLEIRSTGIKVDEEIELTFSVDPGTIAEISYQVFRKFNVV